MVRTARNPRPLDGAALEELALRYVARFATTRAKLESYLARKLRERGWDGEGEPDTQGLSGKLVSAGYIDDAAYARARTDGLLRRGYGLRRVGQALAAAGVERELQVAAAPGEAEQRRAATALARKRGFGPFGSDGPDRARREKQIAAMLRAGHRMEHVLRVIDTGDARELEDWIVEEGSE